MYIYCLETTLLKSIHARSVLFEVQNIRIYCNKITNFNCASLAQVKSHHVLILL